MQHYKILVKGIVQYANKYLVVEKWYDDRIFNPYQWEFVDGISEFGELPDKAVIRILQEKTGLTAEVNRILYTWGFMTGDIFNLGIAYLCNTGLEEVFLSEDLHDAKWIEREHFSEYITNHALLEDIERSDLW